MILEVNKLVVRVAVAAKEYVNRSIVFGVVIVAAVVVDDVYACFFALWVFSVCII